MSSLVSRKKSELAAKVQRLQEKHAGLAAAAHGHDGQQGAGGCSSGVVSEQEYKAKHEAVKAQLPAYKAMKKELADLEAEVGGGRGQQRWAVGWRHTSATALNQQDKHVFAACNCCVQAYVLQQTEEVLRQQDPTGTAPRSDMAPATEVRGCAPWVAAGSSTVWHALACSQRFCANPSSKLGQTLRDVSFCLPGMHAFTCLYHLQVQHTTVVMLAAGLCRRDPWAHSYNRPGAGVYGQTLLGVKVTRLRSSTSSTRQGWRTFCNKPSTCAALLCHAYCWWLTDVDPRSLYDCDASLMLVPGDAPADHCT